MFDTYYDESPANIAGLLANQYFADQNQIPSTRFLSPKEYVDTSSSSTKQNIVSVLSAGVLDHRKDYFTPYSWGVINILDVQHPTRVVDLSRCHSIQYIQDYTLNICDEHQTTTEFHKWNFIKPQSVNVEFRNRREVFHFIEQNPEIMEYVNETIPDLTHVFGKSISIVFELMTHNENEYYEELIGWIQSSDNIDEGLEKFDLFQNNWLERQIKIVGDKFNFNIEFK
jgi:hypothetical protein